MALIVQSSLWLKVNYLSATCCEVLQTFKCSFRAQTMPITRSKQLVGTQEFPMGLIHAQSKSGFKVLNLRSWQSQDDGLAALQRLHHLFRFCYGHSLSIKTALIFESLQKKFRTTPTKIWYFQSKAVYGLKWNILVRLVLTFLQTLKGSFCAQTMPITRSKQLVGTQAFPMGAIQAQSKSRFLCTESTIVTKSGLRSCSAPEAPPDVQMMLWA